VTAFREVFGESSAGRPVVAVLESVRSSEHRG
jgi:hypothetical protein